MRLATPNECMSNEKNCGPMISSTDHKIDPSEGEESSGGYKMRTLVAVHTKPSLALLS